MGPTTAHKTLRRAVADAWLPPPRMKSIEWIPQHIHMPLDTETPGPFNLDKFPHVKDVIEAGDDPHIREIYLPWATRNAKTTTCIAMMACFAANAPRPGLVAGPDEDTVDTAIREKYYPILEACKPLAKQLPPESKRNKKFIKFSRSRIRRGFAGAPSSLAGYPACYFHFMEVSKPQRKSSEASALVLVRQRTKLYPFESKGLFESSPGLKGHCNISDLCLSPNTDRRLRWVPCPHCGEYQHLQLGTKDSLGGLKWEQDPSGHSDLLLAERSAWYQCCHCAGRIENHHRNTMMRSGRWLSEGVTIDKQGELHGVPRVQSSNVSFGDPTPGAGRGLSSLYSLAISGWGQIAKEWLSDCGQKDGKRNFANGNSGEAWDPCPITVQPDDLMQRLCTDDRQGVCPVWTLFLVFSVDVQGNASRFPWVVTGWGPGERGHVVDFGEETSFEALDKLRAMTWPHADGGVPLGIHYSGIDSGDETPSIYTYVRGKRRLIAIKGGSHPFDNLYRLSEIEEAGLTILIVNTEKSQEWIESSINGEVLVPAPKSFSLPAECRIDVDFIAQLLNEHRVKGLNKDGYEVAAWKRRHASQPNDYRDLARYGWSLAQLVTAHGSRWTSLPARNAPTPQIRAQPVLTTPDGRPFFIGDR